MYKPTLHSHRHCQAAQTQSKTQAWQRVCLSRSKTKSTDKPTDEQEAQCPYRRLAQWRTIPQWRYWLCKIEANFTNQTYMHA